MVISDGPNPETNAADLYRPYANGMGVWSRSGRTKKLRRVLSTRADGVVLVECRAGGLEVSIS